MSQDDGAVAPGRLTPASASDGSLSSRTFTVVLPSYHRLPQMTETLVAYLEQAPDEVVVVLDGQHPELQRSEPPFTDPRVRILELPENRGLALARIAGLNVASGDVVLLADDDVVPGPGLVDGHRRHHSETRDLVVVGYMPVWEPERRSRDDGHTLAYGRYYEDVVAGWKRDPSTVLRSIWGGNISIDADLYRRAEAFKESVRLPYYEDYDLGVRCAQVGAVGIFDPKLRAEHRHHVSFEGRLRQAQAQGEAARMLSARWDGLPAGLSAWFDAPWRNRYWRMTTWIPRPVVHAGYRFGYEVLGWLRLWSAQDKLIDVAAGWLVLDAYASVNAGGTSV